MARLKVLIAGGGIGGITAMLALRQRGIDVELFEQTAAFGQVGAGLQVSSNSARILLKLGLGEALKRVATYPEGRDYRGWDTGERLYYTPLGQKAEAHFGSPYYAAHRAELLDVLLSGLGEHGCRLGSRVERVDQDQNGVSLTLADGSTAQGDILIGADGIHSTVRAQLFGKELPRYTGNVAWRGLVPAERVAHLDLGSVVGVWMGPNRSIVQYYVSAGKTFNWIGISRSSQPAQESWLAEGRVEDALAEYDGWHSTIRTIIAADAENPAPGAVRPRASAGLAGRPCRADGRRRASDDAVLRPGRRPKHRRRLRARPAASPKPRTGRSKRSRASSGCGSRAPHGCKASPGARKSFTR